MKIQKVTGELVETLKKLQLDRGLKNEGTRNEKKDRRILELQLPELAQKQDEYSFMFNGRPVATWLQSERNSLDESKLRNEFPEVYQACYLPGKIWTLDVLL